MHSERKSVFLAIQQLLLRSAIEQRLEGQSDLFLAGDSMDGETALRLISAVQPDVVLIEDALPVLSGREVAQRLRELDPTPYIVLLLPPGGRERLSEALEQLADAILFSDDNPAHIVRAVRTVLSGRRFVCPLLGACNACDGFGELPEARLAALSELERDILGLMAEQRSSHNIARYLGISYRELHRLREGICEKLDIDSSHSNTPVSFAILHRREFSMAQPSAGSIPDSGRVSASVGGNAKSEE
jgi:DNA-binding NarL/FixJ family response regulator